MFCPRLYIHSKTLIWHDKNTQSPIFCLKIGTFWDNVLSVFSLIKILLENIFESGFLFHADFWFY